MRALAIARGAPLDQTAPMRFGRALRAAVERHRGGRFVFVDEDGQSELSYTDCWARALRAYVGLRAAGLRPGDPLIVDTGNPASAIPVLWGALLGAHVVAPMAVSRWNLRARQEFAVRLDDVARRLGSPTIVSDDAEGFAHPDALRLSPGALQLDTLTGSLPLPDAESPMLLIATSGTTGRSQLVELGERALMHRWWPAGPGAGGDRTLLGWMPMDHVMGLGMAGPTAMVKIQLAPEAFVRRPERWLELAEAYGVTHAGMSSFGLRLLAAALECGRPFDLSRLQRIGVGTEPVDRAACARFLEAVEALGAPPDLLILGYGLSECGPVAGGERAWRPGGPDDGPVPIDRPTAGHQIRIVGDAGEILLEGEPGAVEVRGPTMASGYHADPAATAQLLTPDGWIRTGDLGWLDDGCLHVVGRAKEVLIVNARKFPCVEIDEVAASVAGVAAAHTFGVTDGAGGIERPALVYVPERDGADLARIEREIREACAARFGFGFFRCAAVRGEDLPRTRSGKLQRNRLSTLLPARVAGPKPPPPVERIDSMLDQVIAVIAQALPGTSPGPDDDFFALGGDSLGALTLAVELERRFGVALPPAVLTRRPTARAIAGFLVAGARRAEVIRIVEPGRHDVAQALFVAPGIWGYNGFAAQMEQQLGPDIGLWTLHLSDFEPKTEWPADFEELVRRCLARLRQVLPRGPYHLAGHSFGGILAFEMARQLISAGERVGTLSLIDLSAGQHGRRPAEPRPEIEPRNRFELNRLLASRYSPGIIDCRIDFYRARDSHLLDLSDPTGGWRHFALGGVSVLDLPGDHHSVVRGEPRRLLAEAITSAIAGRPRGSFHPAEPLPEPVRSAVQLARRSALAGDRSGEVAEFEMAIAFALEASFDPPDWMYASLAIARFDLGLVDAGLAAYRKAFERTSSQLQLAARFAGTLRQHRLTAPMRAAMVLGSRTPIRDVATATACAFIMANAGQPLEAERILLSGIAIVPDSLELRRLLVTLLAACGRTADLLREVEKALELRSENEVAYGTMGKAALQAGGASLALRCFERCLAINPMRSDIARAIARLRQRIA